MPNIEIQPPEDAPLEEGSPVEAPEEEVTTEGDDLAEAIEPEVVEEVGTEEDVA